MNSPWISQVLPQLSALDFGDTPEKCPISVVILAKDEERCIGRCLDSVVGRGIDDIVVVDTGSTDNTLDIVSGYGDRGVRLVRTPWSHSFADIRNFALESVAVGWVVFLDADEWLTEQAAGQLTDCLMSLCGSTDLHRLVFAPKISDVDNHDFRHDIPRIFKTGGAIRYTGPVREYLVVGEAEPPGLMSLDIEFMHDGYHPNVVAAKDKRARNLALLGTARAADPDNPRWLYFTIRDGFPELATAQVVDLCTALRESMEAGVQTGDRQSPLGYYRFALGFACQGLVARGAWAEVHHFCAELDRVDQRDNPDAHYFRTMFELFHGAVTDRDLLRTIRMRSDDDLVAASGVDVAGRHLDALIGVLLAKFRGQENANRYAEMCSPWTDAFFERSTLRGG
jgi:glycosyl transferase family 2